MGLFWHLNCVCILNWIVWNRTAYMYKMDLALNNLHWLMCHKTKHSESIGSRQIFEATMSLFSLDFLLKYVYLFLLFFSWQQILSEFESIFSHWVKVVLKPLKWWKRLRDVKQLAIPSTLVSLLQGKNNIISKWTSRRLHQLKQLRKYTVWWWFGLVSFFK